MKQNKKPILEDIFYVEFYVGNAMQTALYYEKFWGFKRIAYSGFETGNRDFVSYVLKQSKIIIVITAAYQPDHSIARHVALHGDSIKKIAFKVRDSKTAFQNAIAAGPKAEYEITKYQDDYGEVIDSAVKVYGETVHSFVELGKYKGSFMPGFIYLENVSKSQPVGLISIDHITANVVSGSMGQWINFYEEAFGLKTVIYFDENDIFTQHAAMASKVVMNESGSIKLPITEPVNQIRRSQIQEFLDFNRGAGIQHLALNAKNIYSSVRRLRKNGIEFLSIPGEYFNELNKRVSNHNEAVNELKELQIMLDKEDDGLLLQAFTKPILDRPTYFIELIQRKGATSFGKGNVKALFNALVAEQNKRNN